MIETYALKDADGQGWWYYLGPAARTPRLEDGTELTPSSIKGWYLSPVKAAFIIQDAPAKRVFGGWKLKELIAPSTTYPNRIHEDHRGHKPSELELEAMYERVVDIEEQLPTSSPAPTLELVGAPPSSMESVGLTWVVSMPVALRERSEYAHLFPGQLRGVSTALTVSLKRLPGVTAYNHNEFQVFVKRKTGEGDVTARVYGPRVVSSISGANRADALGLYYNLVESWEALVANRTVCKACDGTGWTPVDTHDS